MKAAAYRAWPHASHPAERRYSSSDPDDPDDLHDLHDPDAQARSKHHKLLTVPDLILINLKLYTLLIFIYEFLVFVIETDLLVFLMHNAAYFTSIYLHLFNIFLYYQTSGRQLDAYHV